MSELNLIVIHGGGGKRERLLSLVLFLIRSCLRSWFVLCLMY